MIAIRESLPWSFIGLVGGLIVFLAIVHVPRAAFGAMFLKRLSLAELPAFGIMGCALVVILSYRLALKLALPRALVVAVASIAFALALPRPYAFADPIAYLHLVGESGLFLAIILALVTAGAFVLARHVIRSAATAYACAAVLIIAAALALFFAQVSVGNVLIAMVQPLGALGDTYVALMLITLIETLLWTIGIHGPATVAAIVTPVYFTLQLQNTDAYGHHQPLPHIVVVSLFLFVFPGGAGATLPLSFVLLFSRVQRLRKIARLTIVPAIFNINEPLLFGLPIVFNPFLAVPFIVAPLVLATMTYAAVAYGLVARPALYIPSGVPTLFSAYLATLDVRAIGLALLNIAVATVIYFPFVRAYERNEARTR
ncbi:MAG: PTS transporter subunit EIIC [Candidatus Eremiobacteraeota bacterium]|nr:PTS transporter subunit EIIC [Candidatus Eremiobacteraeota bacterium]